jgi:hypothetical protein
MANEHPDNEKRQLIPPIADTYTATQIARALDETVDLFDDDALIEEAARIMKCWKEMGFFITFKGVMKHIGQVVPVTVAGQAKRVSEPVIWESGAPAPPKVAGQRPEEKSFPCPACSERRTPGAGGILLPPSACPICSGTGYVSESLVEAPLQNPTKAQSRKVHGMVQDVLKKLPGVPRG